MAKKTSIKTPIQSNEDIALEMARATSTATLRRIALGEMPAAADVRAAARKVLVERNEAI